MNGEVKNIQCALQVEQLSVLYDAVPVLWNVSCEIPFGVMLAVVGPNGAGKTTFVQSVLGLVRSMSGSIMICGTGLPNALQHVAYVPQRSMIDWDYPVTVFDVVMMGRFGKKGWFARITKEDVDAVTAALVDVSMLEHKDKPIGQLSGGQQQRCFLARALVQEALVYILDEPFVGVDMATEKAIIILLKKLQLQGKTIIIVHHDLQTLREYFDWVLLLNVSVVGCGPIEQVLVPEYVCKTYGYADMYNYTIKK